MGDPDGVGACGIELAVGFIGQRQRTEHPAAFQTEFDIERRVSRGYDTDGSVHLQPLAKGDPASPGIDDDI
jgi:hypothetical protein